MSEIHPIDVIINRSTKHDGVIYTKRKTASVNVNRVSKITAKILTVIKKVLEQ